MGPLIQRWGNDLYLDRATSRGFSYVPVKTSYHQVPDGDLDRGIRDYGVPIWEDRVAEELLYRPERERPSRNREVRRYRGELDKGYRSSSNERKRYRGRPDFDRRSDYRSASNEMDRNRSRNELERPRRSSGGSRVQTGRYRSSSVDYHRPMYYTDVEMERRYRSSSHERYSPRYRADIDGDRYRSSSYEREGSLLGREFVRDGQIIRNFPKRNDPEIRIVHDTYADDDPDVDFPIVRQEVEILRREPEIEPLPRLRDEHFDIPVVRMERGTERDVPIIRVDRESPVVRDSPIFRSEREIILPERDPEVHFHVPRAVPEGPVFRAPQDRDIPLVRPAHDRDVSSRRPQFERYFPNLQAEYERDDNVHGRTHDFEIPRPLFSPKSGSSYKQRIVSVRVPRNVRPRERVDIPESREKVIQIQPRDHSQTQARDAHTQTQLVAHKNGIQKPHPGQRGVWSEITLQPASKTKFNTTASEIYPPKQDRDGIIAKKRRLINEVIARTDPTFDFFGRNGFGTGRKIRSNPIFLPGKTFARSGTPPVPDKAYFQTIKPSNPEVQNNTPSPPPLPERHYHDILDLEHTRSAISAFTPFEGQIATRNRNPVLAQWQDTLTKGRRHILLESTQRLYDIEENPDY